MNTDGELLELLADGEPWFRTSRPCASSSSSEGPKMDADAALSSLHDRVWLLPMCLREEVQACCRQKTCWQKHRFYYARVFGESIRETQVLHPAYNRLATKARIDNQGVGNDQGQNDPDYRDGYCFRQTPS